MFKHIKEQLRNDNSIWGSLSERKPIISGLYGPPHQPYKAKVNKLLNIYEFYIILYSVGQPLRAIYIGVRGFHSRVILSLGVMGLGSGQFEIFVVVFRPSNKGP